MHCLLLRIPETRHRLKVCLQKVRISSQTKTTWFPGLLVYKPFRFARKRSPERYQPLKRWKTIENHKNCNVANFKSMDLWAPWTVFDNFLCKTKFYSSTSQIPNFMTIRTLSVKRRTIQSVAVFFYLFFTDQKIFDPKIFRPLRGRFWRFWTGFESKCLWNKPFLRAAGENFGYFTSQKRFFFHFSMNFLKNPEIFWFFLSWLLFQIFTKQK